MVSKKFTIINEQGIHMRPATKFVDAVSKYKCNVTVKTDKRIVDGKSVMNLIAACIKYNEEIEVVCDGQQEEEALDAAEKLITAGFDE